MNTLETATLAGLSLIVHHHVAYPALAAWLGRTPGEPSVIPAAGGVPLMTVLMPAHNEADYITAKIGNLAGLDYPKERLRIVIACDGCTDRTEELARAALADHPELDADVMAWPENIGKINTLNRLMNHADHDIAVLTDVSAMLPANTLQRFAEWFSNPSIGAVGAGYELGPDAGAGERGYWRYQTTIKRGESRIGGLIGAHGACYAVRASLMEPLPEDTINDDFMIPMHIAATGWRTVYDPKLVATEAAPDLRGQDASRRFRIGAGNMQQFLRNLAALNPMRPGLAFAFFSGKALRVFMPALLLFVLLGSLFAAGNNVWFAALAAAQVTGWGMAVMGAVWPGRSRFLDRACYAARGYVQSGAGAVAYLSGSTRTNGPKADADIGTGYVGQLASATKRGADICAALIGLALLAPLFPIIALAIRLESPGPVFFRQMRVGRLLHDRTELFMMIKFRSMRQDAEAGTGAVWAQKCDPRITRVGNFLRKTRLDELPQLINVLVGDMSLVGPRPERPGFYSKLEAAIPFYSERTYGLRPGITGLAQVCQGYDETIEDVRSKVMYDHAYAASISRLRDWIQADLSIAFRTVGVMVLGRGR